MTKKSAAARAKQAEQPIVGESAAVEALSAPEQSAAREPVIRVNTSNLTELKNAVDDHLKLVFSSPEQAFKRSYVHDDVRLAIGWTAVGVAAATGYYGYVVDDFQRTKSWVAVGVVVYTLLNTTLALYVALVEKSVIYEGKRRTIASRISTERVTLSSVAYSSPTHHTTSSWVPFPLSLLLPSPPSASNTKSTSSCAAAADDPSRYPLYRLTLSYSHSSNANKSLLASETLVLEKPFGEMFDEEGRLAVKVVEEWVLGSEEGLGKVVRDRKAGSGLLSSSGASSGDENGKSR
ncbi:hypothetical protein JCM10908_006797 [Rhodotorula pacifica]|uniref:signal peptidase complex subunit 2 n=1 Tax=Rhodotorula pacifica TaxID=1495444 RepID=UPI003181D01E